MKKQLSLTILTGLAIVTFASKATATSSSAAAQANEPQPAASPAANPNTPKQPNNDLLTNFNTAVQSTQKLVNDVELGASNLMKDATKTVGDKLEALIGGSLSKIFSLFGGGNGNSDGVQDAAKAKSNADFAKGVAETLTSVNKGLSAYQAASSTVNGQGDKTDISAFLAKANAATLVANAGADRPTSSTLTDGAALKSQIGTETSKTVIGNNGLAQLAANNAEAALLAKKNEALAETGHDTSIEHLEDLKKGIANSTKATQLQTEISTQALKVQAAGLSVDSEKLAMQVNEERKTSAEKTALVTHKGRNMAFLANLTAPQYIPETTK
jgi:hypothetical protein